MVKGWRDKADDFIVGQAWGREGRGGVRLKADT